MCNRNYLFVVFTENNCLCIQAVVTLLIIVKFNRITKDLQIKSHKPIHTTKNKKKEEKKHTVHSIENVFLKKYLCHSI